MLDHEQNLSDEKPGMLHGEGNDFCDDIKEIFSFYELHDEVDEVGVFDQFVETNNKGMFGNYSQNLLFVHDILNNL